MSVPESLTVLTHALTRGTQPTLPGRAPRAGKDAAVLALIGDADTDPFLVFIEKLGTLRHHPGQIAFPGGRMEPEDPSPVAAAVREAREETGLDTTGIEVVGTLPPAYLFAGEWDVTPAVAWWREPHPLYPADDTEIAAVHRIMIDDLTDPAHRSTYSHPRGFRGPAFGIGDLYIWGFTAALLNQLLELGGWDKPWDTERLTAIPERFLAEGSR